MSGENDMAAWALAKRTAAFTKGTNNLGRARGEV